MIKTNDLDTVKALVGNITLEASDHPKYNAIVDAYASRTHHDNNKE
jgi:hypothetical protein